ncbi:uncharacterized protein ACRADG_012876 [Cochliomyia hominivorax]
MLIFDLTSGVLEPLISRSFAVILEALGKVLREIFKFIIILLIIYYFALWIFHFVDEILQSTSVSACNIPNPLEHLVAHQIEGETYPRIGTPDGSLTKKRPSLIEQLEIEVEFEENKAKFLNSEADLEQFIKKEIHTPSPLKRESGDLVIPKKDLFISKTEQELNETSRASQTIKTSLGKQSKLKQERESEIGTTLNEKDLISKLNKIKKEPLNDEQIESPRSSRMVVKKEIKQEAKYFDDQYDHESFHRA